MGDVFVSALYAICAVDIDTTPRRRNSLHQTAAQIIAASSADAGPRTLHRASLLVRPPAKPRISLFPPLRLRVELRSMIYPRSPNPDCCERSLRPSIKCHKGNPTATTHPGSTSH